MFYLQVYKNFNCINFVCAISKPFVTNATLGHEFLLAGIPRYDER